MISIQTGSENKGCTARAKNRRIDEVCSTTNLKTILSTTGFPCGIPVATDEFRRSIISNIIIIIIIIIFIITTIINDIIIIIIIITVRKPLESHYRKVFQNHGEQHVKTISKALENHWKSIEKHHRAMRKQLKTIGKHHWETMGKPLGNH